MRKKIDIGTATALLFSSALYEAQNKILKISAAATAIAIGGAIAGISYVNLQKSPETITVVEDLNNDGIEDLSIQLRSGKQVIMYSDTENNIYLSASALEKKLSENLITYQNNYLPE